MFYKEQNIYYVKEVEVPEGYLLNPTVYTVSPDYGSFEELVITNQPSRCDVVLTKKDSGVWRRLNKIFYSSPLRKVCFSSIINHFVLY